MEPGHAPYKDVRGLDSLFVGRLRCKSKRNKKHFKFQKNVTKFLNVSVERFGYELYCVHGVHLVSAGTSVAIPMYPNWIFIQSWGQTPLFLCYTVALDQLISSSIKLLEYSIARYIYYQLFLLSFFKAMIAEGFSLFKPRNKKTNACASLMYIQTLTILFTYTNSNLLQDELKTFQQKN